jgi:hypothetical protein
MLIKALSGQDDERYDADTLERLQVCAARLAPTEHQALLDAVLSARGRSTPSQYPQLPLELALIDFCLRKQAPATIVAPPITPVISLAPMNPVAPQVTPMSKPIDPESDSTPPVTTETYLANQADVEDLKGKWGRCVTLVGEQNVSFPLILSKAEFTGIDNGCIIVALPYAIQVAKMNEMKNLRLVEEAVAKIAMKPLRLKFVHQAQPETEEVTDIIEVFGGAVV